MTTWQSIVLKNTFSSVGVRVERGRSDIHDLANVDNGAHLAINKFKGQGDVLVRDDAEVVVSRPHCARTGDLTLASYPV